MRLTDILPSGQFVTTVGSIALAGGLIFAANYITHPKPGSASLAAGSTTTQSADWQKTLEDIQAQSPLNRLPQAPSGDSVNTLLNAGTSDNVTDTVAKTLFIKISAAKAQGLGSDIPTQDTLIADAASKITRERGAPQYTLTDLTVKDDSKDALRTYGNNFMKLILAHPTASKYNTLLALGYAIDSNDSSKLKPLGPIGQEYKALAADLLALPVPKTLSPLHLSVINNLARMAETYADMQTIIIDPLRGLGGLKLYQSLTDETTRVLTSIAATFPKNGILFNKDEPGTTWSLFVP